jgi:hypothetical protein
MKRKPTDFSILDDIIKKMDEADKKVKDKGGLQQPRPAQSSSEKPK